MAYLKPQSPIKYNEDHIYPLTTVDQIIMDDGNRLSGVCVTLEKPEESEDTTTVETINADIKPQYPLKNGDNYLYPVTTADQVILSDGSRLEQNGAVIADKFREARAISLTGDVVGTANFDGSNGVAIETSIISGSKHYTVNFPASGWSAAAPYTQTVTVNGIKAADNPIVDINMGDATTDSSADLLGAWALIGRVSTANGSVTAYCYEEKPEVDFSVNIVVIK